ncbi:hypothetical protein CHARACLAT_018441, partial [Characodon lateralis]|nr:hypothetical protein [Characodon lateralis]
MNRLHIPILFLVLFRRGPKVSRPHTLFLSVKGLWMDCLHSLHLFLVLSWRAPRTNCLHPWFPFRSSSWRTPSLHAVPQRLRRRSPRPRQRSHRLPRFQRFQHRASELHLGSPGPTAGCQIISSYVASLLITGSARDGLWAGRLNSCPFPLIVLSHRINVEVSPQTADVVEFSSSVHMSCSSTGSPLSFLWINGTSEVTASDRVLITDGGSNLTIVNVTRYDQETYHCDVSSPLSSNRDSMTLLVSYGPENILLTQSSSKTYNKEGSNINLICSAESRPPAQFTWFLNGDLLPHTGPELSHIQIIQSGNYSCKAFNSKTLKYQTSKLLDITVQ